jgi:hypothetical protein
MMLLLKEHPRPTVGKARLDVSLPNVIVYEDDCELDDDVAVCDEIES